MRARIIPTIMGVVSLLFSSLAPAHLTEPGGVLPHVFTGEHLLILVIVGVCIAGASKVYKRFR